jgi:HlyD family secretion protein
MDIPRQAPKKRNRRLLIGVLAGGVILATIALSQVDPAAPSVKRSSLTIDKVKRGPMLRQVRGPGQLVPEQIRYITTLTPGRVERILVRPGTAVEAGTVLLELGNPDVHIQALESEQALTAARAQLVTLTMTLENQRYTQEAALATVRREYDDAARQATASEELAKEGMVAHLEFSRTQGAAKELAARLEVESKRLDMIRASLEPQLAIQREQVQRLEAISRFQRGQVNSMKVVAGADGVLQGLPLEVGQWVTPGHTLAVVAQPGRLKAVLRVPETQARDVSIGQPASIDTRTGIAKGRVTRIDPAVQNGTVTVDVTLAGSLPAGVRPDMTVDGTIEVDRLANVLHVGRPVHGAAESTVGLYRIEPDRQHASRVPVRLGRGSVNAVEVLQGLKEGDEVILSDMSEWDDHPRLRVR